MGYSPKGHKESDPTEYTHKPYLDQIETYRDQWWGSGCQHQNIAPSYINYFKLKKFQKMAQTRMLLWAPFHLTLLPWDRQKTLMWDIPSLYLEERNTLVSKTRQKDAKENPNKQVLLSFPSYYTYLALLALSYLPWPSTLLKAGTEILKSSSFLRSSIPYRDFCVP